MKSAGIDVNQSPEAVYKATVDAANAIRRKKLLKSFLGVGLLGGGAGLMAGSLPTLSQGIRDIFVGDKKPEDEGLVQSPVAQVPLGKVAGIGQFVEDLKQRMADLPEQVWDIGMGQKATRLLGHPWFLPGATAALTGGYFGARGLQDKFMEKQKRKLQEAELETAKQEYLSALQGENKLGQVLDELFDVCEEKAAELEKSAEDPGMTGYDWAGLGLGGLLAANLLTGTLGYLGGRGVADKFSNRKMLEEAQKLRRRRRYLRQPAPILAAPMPTDTAEEEPEEQLQAAPSLT